jgi:molybdopterin synthase sulfur carrier subunit
MQVKVLFFGVLTEVAGTGIRVYEEVRSVDQLKLRLWDDYPEMVHYDFRISVNNEIIPSDTLLSDGDEVALLPPFAGG